MRRLLPLCAVMLAFGTAPLSVSCTSDDAADPPPLDIGTLSSVSGDLASVGLEFVDATQLAIDDINASGGVLGRKVNLVVRDDGTSTSLARDGFVQLLSQRVPVILGPTTSGQVDSLIDLIANGNTVTIARTTTADKLRNLADNDYFYRLAPSDVYQTEELTKLVVESGINQLCLVHRRDTYGTNLAANVQQKLEARGGGVQVTVSSYEPSTSDLSSVMKPCDLLGCAGGPPTPGCTTMPAEKVGLMLLTYIEDGALILDDAQRRGWSAKKHKLFFSDGVYDKSLLTRVSDPANLEGAVGTAPAGPDPAIPDGATLKRFKERYQARYRREPSIFIENAYDSMYVAAIAIEIAKTATPGPAIRDAMKRVSVAGGVKVQAGDWASIRAAIQAGKPIDFEGASGTVDFDEKGDVKAPYNYVIWRVENGQLVVARRDVVR